MCASSDAGERETAGTATAATVHRSSGACGGGTAVRLHDMTLPTAADDTPPIAPASHRTPVQAGRPPADVLRPGAEEVQLPERKDHCPSTAPTLRAVARQPDG